MKNFSKRPERKTVRPGTKLKTAQKPGRDARNTSRSPRAKTSVSNTPPSKPHNTAAPVFPMRINRYLALKNYSTRRGADEIVNQKKVFINGRLAVVGDKVSETDTVEVKYRGRTAPNYAYIAFNKPVGMTTGKEETESGAQGKDIIASLPHELDSLKLFPLGRLDKESHGLIILTNDGRVTDRLLNPKYEHTKEYQVTVVRNLRANFKEKLEAGLNIEGYATKPAQAKKVSDNVFNITLTEGKTHQIRRMVVALFNEVRDLKRIAVMNIRLDNIAPGGYRKIEGAELSEFLKSLGL